MKKLIASLAIVAALLPSAASAAAPVTLVSVCWPINYQSVVVTHLPVSPYVVVTPVTVTKNVQFRTTLQQFTATYQPKGAYLGSC